MLATGKMKPGEFSNSWHIRNEVPDTLFIHLRQAVTGQVKSSLDSLRPGFGQYYKLIRGLSTYQKIVNNGGWPTVEEGPELSPGDSSQRIAMIRERLYTTGVSTACS